MLCASGDLYPFSKDVVFAASVAGADEIYAMLPAGDDNNLLAFQ